MTERSPDSDDLRWIRSVCERLPGVRESVLQDRPLFSVGRRRFAIHNGLDAPPRRRWAAAGRSLHLLTDPAERDALLQDPRFKPSPHHGDRGWLAVGLDDPEIDRDELAELLVAAHRQVAAHHLGGRRT